MELPETVLEDIISVAEVEISLPSIVLLNPSLSVPETTTTADVRPKSLPHVYPESLSPSSSPEKLLRHVYNAVLVSISEKATLLPVVVGTADATLLPVSSEETAEESVGVEANEHTAAFL
jgi:hypothetical protein